MKINKPTNDGIKKIIFILLLFAVSIIVFRYTVIVRRPWFGTLSADHHQWLSGSTLKFSKNWYREGPISLKFGMIENPKSVEFPTLLSRGPYPSYPPGRILPIYIISKLRGHEPTPVLLMAYNLLNHFFIAFFLSLTMFFFLRQLKFSYWNSFILSIIPLSLELLLPAPLYWHQNVFGPDQAVILPFVLFIFLEVIKGNIENKKTSKITNLLQILVLFYGILTDWLFIFVALTVYIKRILNGEMGKNIYSFIKMSVKYWLPSILVLSLFIFQLHTLGVLGHRIIYKFLFRTGLGAGGEKYIGDFYSTFWKGHVAAGYGKLAIGLLWGSLFLFGLFLIYIVFQYSRKKQINTKIKKTSSLIGILLIPCFIQVYFLKNASAIHDFSALKFSIPLATVPFILIPILICSFLKTDLTHLSLEGLKVSYNNRKIDIRLPVIILCIILSVGIYLKNEHPRFKNLFPEPHKSYEVTGKFISTNTQYKDIVFSPNFEIPMHPPQQLSYSMKRAYKVNSVFDIYDKVNNINKDFEVNIFSVDKNVWNNNYGIEELISAAYDVKQANNLYLYKIKKKDFFENYDELKKNLSVSVTKKILDSNNVFDLYEVKNNYSFIEAIAPEIYEKLNKKYETVLSNYITERIENIISERVSFIDYRWKKIGGGKYKFYFLLKVNKGFEKNWRIYFHGFVTDENINLLPKERQKYKYDNWDFEPNPPTSVWPKDEYIIIAREISARLIPYNMNIGFYRLGEGNHGEQIELGWINLDNTK